MMISFNQLQHLPAGTRIEDDTDGMEMEVVGVDARGNLVVHEGDKLAAICTDFFTGHHFTYFDADGYLITASR